jgi:hypothetical protein
MFSTVPTWHAISGGHNLPLGEEQGDADAPRVRVAHSSQEAAGQTDAERMRIANAQRSKVRGAVEHLFAPKTGPMGLVRRINMRRASVKIGLANLAISRTKHAPA